MVLVGNDPFLGWVTGERTSPIALRHAEMAAFVRHPWIRWRWRLDFALERTDRDATEALRTKIRSKMDVAKVFGAVGTGTLAFLLQDSAKSPEAERSAWVIVAMLAVGAGTVLYLATLFAYDRLLMPTAFWVSRHPPRRSWVARRPPSSDRLILYQNMMHTWRWLFIPACLAIAVGLASLGLAAFSGSSGWWVLGAAAVAVAVGLWWGLQRPRVGASD